MKSAVTILLITYASDIMALMVSCIVKTTTTAMTVMPFLLIFELVFSGGFFELGAADFIKVTTISHWGMDSMSIIGRYNELPMKSLWNTMLKFQDITIPDTGEQPISGIVEYVVQNDMVDDIMLWSGTYNTNPLYTRQHGSSTEQQVQETVERKGQRLVKDAALKGFYVLFYDSLMSSLIRGYNYLNRFDFN